MLPIVWEKSLEHNKWLSKDFNEEITKRTIVASILVGGRKSSLHTENKVSKGLEFLAAFLELCRRIPPKK